MDPSISQHAAALQAQDPRFPDLRNLRDVGGLRTSDGKRVRCGIVYRSAIPSFIDPMQADLLVRLLGIRTRVDLRSAKEVRETPNEHLSMAVQDVAHLPLRAGGGWKNSPDVADPSARVAEHYALYLQHSADSLTEMVRITADPSRGPILLHCTAGKDRTGVALAVMLSAVGVTADDIIGDYGRTRLDLDPLWAQLRRLPAYAERLAALPEESLTAEPRSMELFLELMDSRYGGARAYLLGNGVAEDLLEALSHVLLESAG